MCRYQPTKVALPQKEPEEQGFLFVPGVSPRVLVKGLHMDDRLVLDAARLTLVVEWLQQTEVACLELNTLDCTIIALHLVCACKLVKKGRPGWGPSSLEVHAALHLHHQGTSPRLKCQRWPTSLHLNIISPWHPLNSWTLTGTSPQGYGKQRKTWSCAVLLSRLWSLPPWPPCCTPSSPAPSSRPGSSRSSYPSSTSSQSCSPSSCSHAWQSYTGPAWIAEYIMTNLWSSAFAFSFSFTTTSTSFSI